MEAEADDDDVAYERAQNKSHLGMVVVVGWSSGSGGSGNVRAIIINEREESLPLFSTPLS